MEDPSIVHDKVKEDAQLKEFSETHQVIYKSLTDPKKNKKNKKMKKIKKF